LAVINKKDKKFQYLDSLKGIDTHVMKVLVSLTVKFGLPICLLLVKGYFRSDDSELVIVIEKS